MTEFAENESTAGQSVSSMVQISGGRMVAIATGGSGPSTVVFEAGSPGNAGTWSKVAPLTRSFAPTLVYNRSGYAPSDPISWPRSLASAAADLREIVVATTATPVIAVAHSMGGLIARTAASLWPELFSALALVDTTPVSYLTVAAEHSADRRPGEDEFDVASAAQECVALDTPGCLRDTPVVALIAGVIDLPPDTPAWRRAVVEDTSWRDRFETLSSRTVVRIVEHCDHNIPLHDPAVIADAIHSLLAD